MSKYNLTTVEGLRAGCIALNRPENWPPGGPEWVPRIGKTIRSVRAADVRQRATREFQQMLWENNHIAAIGQGRISVQRALNDPGFRSWLAEALMAFLPSNKQVQFLSRLYDELQTRLTPFLTGRMPHLKISA